MDIGTLGGTYSEGTGINDLNEIAGVSSVTGSTLNHLFLYAKGHMSDLGTVAGQSIVNALINNRGEIAGSATGSNFIFRGHSFEKIPLAPAGLNNKGHIAGSYTAANGSSHASLYRDGRLIDLNDLVDPSLTFLTSANGISDNGKIVAKRHQRASLRAHASMNPPSRRALNVTVWARRTAPGKMRCLCMYPPRK